MGNRFKCSLAHGGSGGAEGNTLIVTCDSAFAGHTISASKSGTTYTQTCPSSSPYTVTFHGLEAGTWTISAIVSGDTYSTSVTITDSTALLSYGFNWATWVTLGGLDPTDFSDLSDVFADEAAVRRLMLVHASADYLIDAVTGNVDVIDNFCADDTAMKWIGLCDYVCDGLTAIAGVETKFLASTYWERYLKDHVPTMTGNMAPYGTASATNNNTGAYKAFNGTNESGTSDAYEGSGLNIRLEYEFPTPICVKKILVANRNNSTVYAIENFKLQGSNDGTTWTDIGSFTKADGVANEETFSAASNTTYFKKLGIYITSTYDTSSTHYSRVGKLQFYGRSLNVSVPVMTGNTAPFGEVIGNGSGNYSSWHAFGSSGYAWNTGSLSVIYDFGKAVVVKAFDIATYYYSSHNYKIIASNDGENYEDVLANVKTVIPSLNDQAIGHGNVENNKAYRYYGFAVGDSDSYLYPNCNFYGVDYSEKEFEAGTSKKWLYDHGVELETLTTSGAVVKGNDYLTLSAANSEATAAIDLTPYSTLHCKVGDNMSGTTQLSVGGSSPAVSTLTSNNAPNNESLDIASYNQTLATGVKMTANGICDIKELWAA